MGLVLDIFRCSIHDGPGIRTTVFLKGCNELILSNLDLLYQAGARIFVRCPLVPGINDDEAHLRGIAELARKYPNLTGMEIMPYHRMGNEKGRRAGLAVKLDIPNADTAAKANWKSRLAELGCQILMN